MGSGLLMAKSLAGQERGLTKRAPDVWDSAAFSSIFLASSFSCSQAESTPAHTQVTQTVGRSLQGAKVMKYLERMLQEGWQVSITLADDGCFYIDVVKESMQRMGFSKESLSKALEELLETMKGDGVI